MWTKSSKGIGIAVCNFDRGDILHAINLRVCDTVVIQEECNGWYKGYLFNNREWCGIFPTAYVHIKTSSTGHHIINGRQRESDAQLDREDEQIVDELTQTLKEWNRATRACFINSTHPMLVLAVENETFKLLKLRSQFSAPYLTRLEREQLRSDITNKIDWGNKKLELDLVPRVNGLQVDPDSMSPVELYGIHDVKHTKKEQREQKSQAINSHHLFMKLNNLSNAEKNEDLAIYFSLYNYKADRPAEFITERAMCKLNKDGSISDLESSEFFSATFVDLTSVDLSLDLYLTAHIYRLGGLHKGAIKNNKSKNSVVAYKRPYGCAALSLKEYLQGRTQVEQNSEEMGYGREFSMPLLLTRKDEDFSTITDVLIMKMKNKRLEDRDYESVNVALEMFHGDIRSVRQDYPQFFTRKIKITQKLGFADVIAPEYSAHYVLLHHEIRNDFYINLYEAEFEKGNKTAERNVEAKVLVVRNDDGKVKECVYSCGGDNSSDHYETAVFYHCNKPRWNEVIKISLPIHSFSECHLRIEFRHCPAQGAEKKLFGFSFLPLEDKRGATVADGIHNLLLYKSSDFNKNSRPHYLDMEFQQSSHNVLSTKNDHCTLSPRESCTVRTTLCSTKLTQDVNLLNILKWQTFDKDGLVKCLNNVVHIKGDELMRHHADFLNSLFQMTCNSAACEHMDLIFKALVQILHLLEEKNFSQFRPMFILYIERTFCAPLVHRDILGMIKQVLEQQQGELLNQVSNVLDMVFKFIVKSAQLYAKEHTDKDHRILASGMDNFWKALQKVVKSSGNKTTFNTKNKMSLIARVVDVFPDLLQVLPADKLASSFAETISKIPKRDSDMGEHKLKCLSKLINSPLFSHQDSRRIVLELCDSQLESCLRNHQDIKLAAQNLSDLLAAIHKNKDEMRTEVESVTLHLMRVLCTAITELGSYDCVGLLISSLITMLEMMDEALLELVITQQCDAGSLNLFLDELLQILTGAITKTYIPSDWLVMLMVVNWVILKSAKYLSKALKENFFHDFDKKLWQGFFELCVSFMTQPCLQLENFHERKQWMVKSKYGDMRLSMVHTLLDMWNTLSMSAEKQRLFLPSMVGPFLKVSLIPENDLRMTFLPVFYDMLKANFGEVHASFIDELDRCYNECKGDRGFSVLFSKTMLEQSAEDEDIGSVSSITQFVESADLLIQRLLDYRAIMTNSTENMNTLMLCTVNLLDFYQNHIRRGHLYSHYIYKLRDLNVQSKQYTEAGFTLLLNAAHKLGWTDDVLCTDTACPSQAEWERKKNHYLDIINFFDEGQSWEDAIPLCKELSHFYEMRLYDYSLLSDMLEKQASLYRKIQNHGKHQQRPRLRSKYYRVALYGDTLPLCVRNQSFVYRGDAFCVPGAVINMLKAEFPSLIQLKDAIEPPDHEDLQPNKQYFQSVIINPEPELDGCFSEALRAPSHNISDYYQWNQINTFTYDKPFHEPAKDKDNEHRTLHKKRYLMRTAKSLPGILHWCEITDMKIETLEPIIVAVDTLTKKNSDMRATVQVYRSDRARDQKDLSMMLKGTVDAKVNGGIMLYQKAFLQPQFAMLNPQHDHTISQLKVCIQEHMMVIRDGLELFREIVSADLKPLMKSFLDEYKELRDAVMEQDPSADIVSLASSGSGSMSAVRLSSDSARPSSGYSSSDHDTQREEPLSPRRKHPSVSYSSRDNLSLEGLQTTSPQRTDLRREASILQRAKSSLRLKKHNSEGHLPGSGEASFNNTPPSKSSKPQRSSSIFYSQTPEVSEDPQPDDHNTKDSLGADTDSSSSDEDKGGTLTRENMAPPIPKKQRSSSLTSQTPLLESPLLSPGNPNRPLPQVPSNQRKPVRSNTVSQFSTSGNDSVYNSPRPTPSPTTGPRRHRPLPPTPQETLIEGETARTPPPPRPRKSLLAANDASAAPPIPKKSAILRQKSQQQQ